jgi:hypothetical protein
MDVIWLNMARKKKVETVKKERDPYIERLIKDMEGYRKEEWKREAERHRKSMKREKMISNLIQGAGAGIGVGLAGLLGRYIYTGLGGKPTSLCDARSGICNSIANIPTFNEFTSSIGKRITFGAIEEQERKNLGLKESDPGYYKGQSLREKIGRRILEHSINRMFPTTHNVYGENKSKK